MRAPSPHTSCAAPSAKPSTKASNFLWRDQRLIVETDSFLYHRGSISFEDDYARDLDLRSEGYTVLRFADTQIEDEPDRVAALVGAELASALAR